MTTNDEPTRPKPQQLGEFCGYCGQDMRHQCSEECAFACAAGTDETFTVDTVPAHLPTRQILGLIRSFPCLQSIATNYLPERFEADEFLRRCGRLSSGEMQCLKFCLAVWNPAHYGDAFGLTDFVARVDLANRQPLLAWIANPFWP